MSIQWELRNTELCIEVKYLKSIPVITHPLSGNGRNKKSGSNSMKKHPKSPFKDPLNITLDGADPLTIGTENDPLSCTKIQDKENLSFETQNFKSWEEICSQYLSKCSTKHTLSFASNFPLNSELGTPNFENLGYNKAKGSTQTESERIRLRMDYLSTMENNNSSKMLTSLTADQFAQYISYLKSELLKVWKSEHRVKALKIVKEAAKSLGLSTPELFYPQKFMLIADLITTLGNLVYQRLNEIPNTESASSISSEAKEITRNWFSNITSIRDLLPRIYLEAALLQCYAFSNIETIESAFERLLKMTRGLGDPLVSAYAKMFVVKSGLGGRHMVHVTTAIADIKDVLQWGWSEQGIETIEVGNEICANGKEISEQIFYPPLLWLIQCLVNHCSSNSYQTIFEICSKSEKLVQYLFIKATLTAFPASFVANECIAFNELVSQCFQNGTDSKELLIYYGKIMNLAPSTNERKFSLMSAMWNLLCSLDSLDSYVKACDIWIQYSVQNFEVNDIEKILSNLVKKMNSLYEENPQSYHSDLLRLVVNMLGKSTEPDLLLLRPNLQQLLIMLQREVVGPRVVGKEGKTRLSLTELRELLETIIAHHPSSIRQKSLIKILIELFSSLHDRVNALTTSDEKRQIAQLLRDFILKVEFDKDFTQQLEFYVNCRASFVKFDSILEILIHQVCKLQMETLAIMKRKHNTKTASFERACTAYCFITIPSLASSILRLNLYILTGSVAMVNCCLSQAQTCIESAIKEVEKSAELLSNENGTMTYNLQSAILCLISCLIATPCLYESSLHWFVNVTKAVLNASHKTEFAAKINIAVLKAVCSSSRKCLPYYFNGVLGNDSIFSLERRHLEAVDICNQQLLNLVNSVISTNSDVDIVLKTELLECLLQYGDGDDNTKILTRLFKCLIKESDKIYYKKKIKTFMQLSDSSN